MNIKNPITKVAVAGIAAGAVAFAAIGAGSASADGYGQYVPNMGLVPQPPVVNNIPVVNPYYYQYNYNRPVLVNGRWVYPYQQAYVNVNPYVYQYQYLPVTVTATQFSFITATASVLNMNRADVVAQLQQGKSLTQIAGEQRGINNVNLQNAVLNTMRGSINAAVASGAVSPVTGNTLQASLNNRLAAVLNQLGTSSGTNASAIETAYQLF